MVITTTLATNYVYTEGGEMGGKSASRHPRLTRGSKEKARQSFTSVTRTDMGSRERERFERSNRQIWGDRALVRARASRGPDAIETSLKTYNPVDETLDARYVKVVARKDERRWQV